MVLTSRGSTFGIGLSFPIIGAVLVVLRVISRRYLKLPFLMDDWLCFPSLILLIGACATLLYGFEHQLFVPEDLSDPSAASTAQQDFARMGAAISLLWLLANTTIKLSTQYYYRRIFRGREFNIASWTLIILTVLWGIYGVLAWLIFCGNHFRANFEGGWGVCPSWGGRLQIATYFWSSIIDFCMLLLPVPFIWRLQLPARRRAFLVFAFLIGGLAFVASLNNSVIQFIYLTQNNFFSSNPSSTLEGVPGAYFQQIDLMFFNWSNIEIGVGFIACNLLTLSPHWARSAPQRIRQSTRSARHSVRKFVTRSMVFELSGGESERSKDESSRRDVEQDGYRSPAALSHKAPRVQIQYPSRAQTSKGAEWTVTDGEV